MIGAASADGARGGAVDEPAVGARTYLSLVVLLLMVMLSYLDRGIIILVIDPIKADLAISDVQVSLLQGVAFAAFYALATVPMGWLADRWSRHGVIFLGVIGWSVATMLCGLAGSFRALFAARSLVGIGEASLQPAANSLVADLFPGRRLTLALGILAAGAAIGSGLATFAGGLVVRWAEQSGGIGGLRPWQAAFVIVGVPGFLIAPLVFLIPAVARTRVALAAAAAAQASTAGYGAWLRRHRRYLTGIAGGIGCTTILSYAQGAWTAAFLSRHFHLDVATIGATLGLIAGGAGTAGFIGGGWLVDRLQAAGVRDAHFRYLMVNMAAIGVLGVIAYAFVESLPVLLALLTLIFLLQPATPAALAHLQSATPHRYRARTVAIVLLVMNLLGMSLGPSSVALASEHLFGGPEQIGRGIALVSAIVPLPGIALLLFGLAAGRRAQAEVSAG